MSDLSNIRVGYFNTKAKNPESYYAFEPAFEQDAGKKVIVLADVQTRRGPNIPNLRIWNVTNEGFNYHFDELDAQNVRLRLEDNTVMKAKRITSGNLETGEPFHKAETIGFMAIEVDTIEQ